MALLWQELIDRSIKPESPKAIIGDIVNIFFRTVQWHSSCHLVEFRSGIDEQEGKTCPFIFSLKIHTFVEMCIWLFTHTILLI